MSIYDRLYNAGSTYQSVVHPEGVDSGMLSSQVMSAIREQSENPTPLGGLSILAQYLHGCRKVVESSNPDLHGLPKVQNTLGVAVIGMAEAVYTLRSKKTYQPTETHPSPISLAIAANSLLIPGVASLALNWWTEPGGDQILVNTADSKPKTRKNTPAFDDQVIDGFVNSNARDAKVLRDGTVRVYNEEGGFKDFTRHEIVETVMRDHRNEGYSNAVEQAYQRHEENASIIASYLDEGYRYEDIPSHVRADASRAESDYQRLSK